MEKSEIIINEGYGGLNPVIFGFENCKPGHSFGPAVRHYWLLHYVVSGRGKFIRDGNTYFLRSGDIFVIPPMQTAYYEADRQDPWYYIWVGFSADKIPNNIFNRALIHLPSAGRIFQEMKACSSLEGGRSAFLSAKLWELTSLLLDEGNGLISHVDKALSIIHSEYASDITVSGLADRLNLDRTYFSSLFKKNVGLSPIKYLCQIRLNQAAELIKKHGMPPSVAALSVGYSDYCNFVKAFKKQFGSSPKEYKSLSKNSTT